MKDLIVVESSAMVAMSIHVRLKIPLIHKLKDKHEFTFVVDNIAQGDYALVLQLFYKGDLANSDTWDTFFGIETDLLKSYELASWQLCPLET
jgi:hypothetical protein